MTDIVCGSPTKFVRNVDKVPISAAKWRRSWMLLAFFNLQNFIVLTSSIVFLTFYLDLQSKSGILYLSSSELIHFCRTSLKLFGNTIFYLTESKLYSRLHIICDLCQAPVWVQCFRNRIFLTVFNPCFVRDTSLSCMYTYIDPCLSSTDLYSTQIRTSWPDQSTGVEQWAGISEVRVRISSKAFLATT